MSCLNQKYTFKRFIVGRSNEFAHAAAIAVTEQPAKIYNPLFIYGKAGLGKTHLLNAIGLMMLDSNPDLNVMYVSAESIMNELNNHLHNGQVTNCRDKYFNASCLLIDDFHCLSEDERIQEEFYNIISNLHDTGKQVVIASDQYPQDISKMETRLRSCFQWALIADVRLPENAGV